MGGLKAPGSHTIGSVGSMSGNNSDHPSRSSSKQFDTPEAQLEFQNFVLNSAESNLSGSVKIPPAQVAASSSNSALPDFLAPAPGTQPRSLGTAAFWTLEFYAQFFNVDFEDVRTRISEAIIPRSGFQEKIAILLPTHINPKKLTGPFWISTTVIFCLFMTSTMAGSITAYINGQKDYTFDMTLLSMASVSVYLYVLMMPTVFWGLGKYFAAPVVFFEALNVYGYGLTIWIPVSVLCILPSELLRWAIILAAFGVSTYFLYQNVLPPFATSPRGQTAQTAALVALVVGNAGLALLFRFGFFRYIVAPSTVPGTPVPSAGVGM
ncbi:hypothetical protein HDU67_005657 [Dinochytrium kinnereticum]|nr:hypothetical protein HDU67_005657 [Dinochytrium kinnereticum]